MNARLRSQDRDSATRLTPTPEGMSIERIVREWDWLREAMPEAEASRQRYADLYDFAPRWATSRSTATDAFATSI